MDRSREANGLTESRAGAGHLLLKPGEHVGHDSRPGQGSLLRPSLLVQRECITAPGQAQPPHQLSSHLEGREHKRKVRLRPRRGPASTSGRVQLEGSFRSLSPATRSPYQTDDSQTRANLGSRHPRKAWHWTLGGFGFRGSLWSYLSRRGVGVYGHRAGTSPRTVHGAASDGTSSRPRVRPSALRMKRAYSATSESGSACSVLD